MTLQKIAVRNFVIEAPQRRVWDLLGPALLNSPIGLEKIDIIDENHIRAEVHIKFAFLPITAQLMMIFLELEEPEKMVVALNAKALKGLVRLNQRVTFAVNPQDDKHTEVRCEVLAERHNSLLFRVVAKKARSSAETTLMGIEETLRRLA